MNFIISSLFILLVSLPHSSFALAKLEDAGVNKMREFSRNAKDMVSILLLEEIKSKEKFCMKYIQEPILLVIPFRSKGGYPS